MRADVGGPRYEWSVSGPLTLEDVVAGDHDDEEVLPAGVLVAPSRAAMVGSMPVRRALPSRGRRTVGAWCFVDHFGPAEVGGTGGMDVGPHPHIGLQTVTWLLAGEILHRDSLGSEQLIRPGELNLMSAGHGVAHSEEATGSYRGELHGLQLWVAQPAATRDGPPAFEHHGELPQVEIGGATATVLVGVVAGAGSPARRDSEHLGADLVLHGPPATVPLDAAHEHALVVTGGVVRVEGTEVGPGRLAYLAPGREELDLAPATDAARALLLGGPPLRETVAMWWNFVARTHEEIDAAFDDWTARSPRFGVVASTLAPLDTAPPPWRH